MSDAVVHELVPVLYPGIALAVVLATATLHRVLARRSGQPRVLHRERTYA